MFIYMLYATSANPHQNALQKIKDYRVSSYNVTV